MIDEGFDLRFKFTRQEVVFKQDTVILGLMPSFDLALFLQMVRCAMRVLKAFVFQPFC